MKTSGDDVSSDNMKTRMMMGTGTLTLTVQFSKNYPENGSKLKYNGIFFSIIKNGWQCKTGRERLTPYQSEDHSPTISSNIMKDEKPKTV